MHSHEYESAPCDTQGQFFDNLGRTGLLTNSIVGANPEINDDAVFSILQFGAIIPPLSPWKGIHRFVPGYQYQEMKMVGPVELLQHQDISILNPEQQADEVEQLLDKILKENIGDNEEDPVLLFSGGVDSGLIASRLAALGYCNSLLINFSFGDDDLESKLAEEMASELGLPFMRVSAQDRPSSCLDNPGKIYTQPFGDYSTAPTSDLAQSVVKYLSNQKRLIIDGTGADGAFGMTAKIRVWKKVSRVPVIVRKAVSLAYGRMLWHH
jgi:asparagine synthase (glutamine-hydrolysing)